MPRETGEAPASRAGYPKKNRASPDTVARIKAWTRAALVLGDDVVLSVSQVDCAVAGCPPAETVVLVMPAGRRASKYTVHKPIADVTEADIAACAAGPSVAL